MTQTVTLYTDGACSGNPGPGGWGAVLIYGDQTRELHGGTDETTNNRMELQAVIEGLNALKRPCPVTIYTDSKYVMDGITKWVEGWIARGWKTAAKKPVKNQDLWQDLITALKPHDVQWQWVKGHSGDPLNDRADALARRYYEAL